MGHGRATGIAVKKPGYWVEFLDSCLMIHHWPQAVTLQKYVVRCTVSKSCNLPRAACLSGWFHNPHVVRFGIRLNEADQSSSFFGKPCEVLLCQLGKRFNHERGRILGPLH